MTSKLHSELDLNLSRKSFEILRNNTTIFQSWTKTEIYTLCDWFKILSFRKGQFLTKRNEKVDFFGIMLSGRAFLTIEAKSYGYIEEADFIGYMNFMKLKGADLQYFDIVAEKEGYLALIKTEELRLLQKKNSLLWFKIYEIMAQKTLNIVNFHYMKMKFVNDVIMNPCILNPKKIFDLMESCPPLREFFESLEKRDKKYLISSSQIFEIEPNVIITRANTKGSSLIFVLKGEVVAFPNNENSVFYKAGSILGAKQFLFDISWKDNIFGSQRGFLMKLDKSQFMDIVQACPNTAMLIYQYLIKSECKQLQTGLKPLENKQDPMDTNTNANLSENPRGMKTITKNTQDTNEDFIEIDINKRVENLKEENKAKDSLIFEKFKTNYDIAPLYVHEVFQQKNSLKNLPIGSKTDKSSKDLNSNTGASIFLVEKLEKQILETKQKKMEMKMMKKTFSNSEKKNFESFNKNTGKEGSEEDYELLKNDLKLLTGEYNELDEKYRDSQNQNKHLREEIKKLSELNIYATSKIKKYELQKELLSKGISSSLDNLGLISKKYKKSTKSLADLLNDQIKINNKYQLVARCAYKWLFITRKSLTRKTMTY